MKKPLDVAFTIGDQYIRHFTVALTSLLENSRDAVGRVFLIHDIADPARLDKPLRFFKRRYGVAVEPLTLSGESFDRFSISHHLSRATYFRLQLAEILPPEIDRILFLDSDLVVVGDLSALAATDFSDGAGGEYLALAVDHQFSEAELARMRALGLRGGRYFNAGVLLLNLAKFRRDGITRTLMQVASDERERLSWMDQDVLNLVLDGRWGALGSEYNHLHAWMPGVENPRIVHFAGSSKPWQAENNHPYKPRYHQYLRLTPYRHALPEGLTLKLVIKRMLPARLSGALKYLRDKIRSH